MQRDTVDSWGIMDKVIMVIIEPEICDQAHEVMARNAMKNTLRQREVKLYVKSKQGSGRLGGPSHWEKF